MSTITPGDSRAHQPAARRSASHSRTKIPVEDTLIESL